MTYFYDSSEIMRVELVPGLTIRTMWGEKIMMSVIENEPNAEVPMHTHPHEQAGIVMEGGFDMTIGEETRRMKPGMAYVIPGGVPHGIKGIDVKGKALDIFSPPREEYKEKIKSVDPRWKEEGASS